MSDNNSTTQPIFHRKAIVFIFTTLSTSFFGGIIFCQNLHEAGRKREVPKILIGCGLWQLVASKLLSKLGIHDTTIHLFLPSLITAIVLSTFAWNYQFKDINDYKKRSIWVPLIILFVVYGLLIGAILFKK